MQLRRKQAMARLLLAVVLPALVGCAALPIAQPSRPTAAPTATADPDRIVFPDGHVVEGAFGRFWRQHGGTAVFGRPLTATLPIDGVWTQYFERARFELGADGAVRLGALGREALAAAALTPVAAQPRAGCRFFEATAHNLCPPLLEFWEQHGGAALLGAPISEATTRDQYITQYFERARIDKPVGGAAMLADLGAAALQRLPAADLLRAPTTQAAPQRAWLRSAVSSAQPLDVVRLTLATAPLTATATIIWSDGQGRTERSTVAVRNGRAALERVARGALGPHGAVVLLDGRVAGVQTAVFELTATTAIHTGQPRFDELIPRVRAFLDHDILEFTIGHRRVRGYRSPDNNMLWLRDHVHQSKGFAYWEADMTSLLDQFRRMQRADGSFDDYLGQVGNTLLHGRKEVEADLEYLFIEGVYRAWQATGDDAWMQRQLPAAERGLQYVMSHPWRWDATHRLVKRPYTIDTWDFEIGAPTISPDGRIAPRHWIDAQTKWSIFHGDNTGYAYAMQLLARMYEHLGNHSRAAHWRREAQGLMQRLNALAWNGRFFRHMVPLTPVDLPVDTEAQLSLSNAYALNREVLSAEQARAIIAEYQARRRPPDQAFAEWYSIDPPFPAGTVSIPPEGKGHRPGEYVNGGIMPLVGGELAQGAFRWGAEAYGFDILQRYYSLIAGTGASYLWYYPIGQPGISGAETLPTDGWGASAMLAALIEGAAGVQDRGTRFAHALIAPRWSAAPDVSSARVTVRYGASDGYVAYHWQRQADGLRLRWTGSGTHVTLRLLLPPAVPAARVLLDGRPITTRLETVGASHYLVVEAPASGDLTVRW
ncbi:hypothetical protein [Kallotenue papyrolyticum]|uniref:hypothetical protein n=1 Tax=Kallotenue papyrolyticum TaxID=1325125 RepID=UPI0004B6BAF8|nr:hypothetical protein [Kallotenue papyrolyticum]